MNGDAMIDRLEYKDQVKKLSVEDRAMEAAMGVYDLNVKFDAFAAEIKDCIEPKSPRKTSALIGGITAVIVSALAALIEYFRMRG